MYIYIYVCVCVYVCVCLCVYGGWQTVEGVEEEWVVVTGRGHRLLQIHHDPLGFGV